MSAGVVNNLDLDLLQTFFHSLANYFGGERLHMTIIPMIVMIFLVVTKVMVDWMMRTIMRKILRLVRTESLVGSLSGNRPCGAAHSGCAASQQPVPLLRTPAHTLKDQPLHSRHNAHTVKGNGNNAQWKTVEVCPLYNTTLTLEWNVFL